MSKLIIINGATGVGKSTVALELHKSLPMAFLLEIDALRRHFSRYKELRKESLFASYGLALTICEQNLKQGRNVIIEKVIADNDDFLEDLISIGKSHGVDIYEIILNASKDVVVKRAADRGFKDGGSLTLDKVISFWEQIQDLIKRRSNAFVVDTDKMEIEDVLVKVKEHVNI